MQFTVNCSWEQLSKKYKLLRLLAAKRLNVHVIPANRYIGLQIICNSQDPMMHRENLTKENARKTSLFRAFMCAAR